MCVETCCHLSYSKDSIVILINSCGDGDYIQICNAISRRTRNDNSTVREDLSQVPHMIWGSVGLRISLLTAEAQTLPETSRPRRLMSNQSQNRYNEAWTVTCRVNGVTAIKSRPSHLNVALCTSQEATFGIINASENADRRPLRHSETSLH
jgi:hypothetical protein